MGGFQRVSGSTYLPRTLTAADFYSRILLFRLYYEAEYFFSVFRLLQREFLFLEICFILPISRQKRIFATRVNVALYYYVSF